MKIKTANTSYIGLPLCPASFFNTSTVNITIDWGDSTIESFSSLSDPNITQAKDGSSNVIANIFRHSYLSGDNYTINVSGGFGSSGEEKLAFCQQSKQSSGIAQDISESLEKASFGKITGIEELSNFCIHGQGDFKGFTNLIKIANGASGLISDNPSSSIVLSSNANATMLMDKTFEDCSSLTEMNFTPENLTSTQYTFKNSSYSPTPAWKIHDNWDMSNVVSVRGMFEGSSFNGYVSKFDMSSVQDCSAMFKNSKAFNQWIDSWFDGTNSLTNTSSMFEGAEAFNNKVASWDMSSVQDCSAMFKNTKVFNKWVDSLFNGSSNAVTNMSSMFEGAKAFNNKVASWNLVSVEDVSSMFKNCTSFNKSLYNWFKKDSSKNYSVKNMSSMFEGSVFNLDLSGADNDNDAGWDTTSVENMSYMFKDMPVTLNYSVDRVLQRAVNSGKLKKSTQFIDGTNMRKGWNDTHSSKFSATASLSSNVLTINATLVGNYDYWSYKVVNTNTQSFASVSEVLVQNGDTSVDITLDPGSYEIYAKGYIS